MFISLVYVVLSLDIKFDLTLLNWLKPSGPWVIVITILERFQNLHILSVWTNVGTSTSGLSDFSAMILFSVTMGSSK